MGETVGQNFNGDGVTIYGDNSLALRVDGATYDPTSETASIHLKDAFDKREAIMNATGDITLVYKGFSVDTDSCPEVDVPLSSVSRSSAAEIILSNSVDIGVAGIDQQTANEIEAAKCLTVDNSLARGMVN